MNFYFTMGEKLRLRCSCTCERRTRCPLTCTLSRERFATLLSAALANADTFPLGSFSSFETAWRPSLVRLHWLQRRRAATTTSWSQEARSCTKQTDKYSRSIIIANHNWKSILVYLYCYQGFICSINTKMWCTQRKMAQQEHFNKFSCSFNCWPF